MTAVELMNAVRPLVMKAGQETLPFWRTPLDVMHKSDASPVTEADMAAHRVLVAGLQALSPEIPVLSEESCEIPLDERQHWSRWWLVDPVDGTKEFIAGTPEFTVNVALIDQGRVVFGVVGVPAADTCYWGGAELGAWCQLGDEPPQGLQVRVAEDEEPFRIVASRRHSGPQQERLLDFLQARMGPVERVNIGSSLKFCMVAAGQADCYPRLLPTSQWDTAAAQGVLEGAGGELLDLSSGEVLQYGARADFINPAFLALPAAAAWRNQVLEQACQAAAGD